MGMFKDLMDKIFHHGQAQAQENPKVSMNLPGPRPVTTAPAGAATNVDVAAVLDKLASSNKEKLDWKHSIVDLMKLVGMDSSITARKALAADLHYTGDTNDSATMNMWLHKEVMQKLAANGGKVPADLLNRK